MHPLRVVAVFPVALAIAPAVAQGPRAERAVVSSMEDAAFAGDRWYVADEATHRVHVLDQRGQLTRTIGGPGRATGQFDRPVAVAATASRLYVADRGRNGISEFTPDGRFVRFLYATEVCPKGSVARLTIGGGDVFLLRRCPELPHRIRYQVERLNGSRFEPWSVIADTVHVRAGAGVPIHFPIMAANDSILAVGEGGSGCVRMADHRTGRRLGTRCFTELARRAVPDSARRALTERWRGQVAVPDSLPRIRSIALLDGGVAAYAVESLDEATWTLLPLVAGRASPRRVGRAHVAHSFVASGTQIVGAAGGGGSGMRVEVLPWK